MSSPLGPNLIPLSAADLAVFKQWEDAIKAGRRSMERLAAAGAAMAWIEDWRRSNAPGVPPCFDQAGGERITRIFGRWNRIEEIYAGCLLGRFGVTVDRGDLMIHAAPLDREPGPGVNAEGLGFPWAFIVAGVVLIIGAIVTVKAIDAAAKKEAGQNRLALRQIDAQMAAAPPDVRAAYERMKKEDPVKKELSIWDRLENAVGGFFENAGMLVVLGLAAWFIVSRASTSSSSAPRAPAEAVLIRNPCGGTYLAPPKAGGRNKPGGVSWSYDKAKRNRQASYVSGWYYGSPDEREWIATRRRKGGGGWQTVGQDEVPF